MRTNVGEIIGHTGFLTMLSLTVKQVIILVYTNANNLHGMQILYNSIQAWSLIPQPPVDTGINQCQLPVKQGLPKITVFLIKLITNTETSKLMPWLHWYKND